MFSLLLKDKILKYIKVQTLIKKLLMSGSRRRSYGKIKYLKDKFKEIKDLWIENKYGKRYLFSEKKEADRPEYLKILSEVTYHLFGYTPSSINFISNKIITNPGMQSDKDQYERNGWPYYPHMYYSKKTSKPPLEPEHYLLFEFIIDRKINIYTESYWGIVSDIESTNYHIAY